MVDLADGLPIDGHRGGDDALDAGSHGLVFRWTGDAVAQKFTSKCVSLGLGDVEWAIGRCPTVDGRRY